MKKCTIWLIRAETNTTIRRVLVKDLVLKYSLRSRDPAHMMYLSSGSDTMEAVEI